MAGYFRAHYGVANARNTPVLLCLAPCTASLELNFSEHLMHNKTQEKFNLRLSS